MSLPRYPEYKDSGVAWLGEVPGHWEVVPLKHLAEFVNGDAFKPTEWATSGIPIIRIQNLNGSEDFNYYDGDVEQRYLVHDGDLLFGWSGNRGTSFGPFLWRRNEVCALNQHIFRVVPVSAEKRSLFWILKAVTAHVEDQAHGIIGMVHVTKGDLGAINVPISPIAEQPLIAAFLDRETGKIDALVAEQEKLIAMLKEKRQAVISHAVTKGLPSTGSGQASAAKMKDSGIEWLGEVPEHWVLKPIKTIASCNDEVLEESTPKDYEIEYIEISGVDASQGIKSTDILLFGDAPSRARRRVQDGDVLVSTVRTYLRAIAPVINPPANMIASTGFAVIRPRYVDSHFLGYVFRAEFLISEVIAHSVGVSYPAINASDLMRLNVPVPPLEEQTAIAAYLDRETAKLNALTAEAQRATELLKERRSALISAAVTGKIDVRAISSVKEAA